MMALEQLAIPTKTSETTCLAHASFLSPMLSNVHTHIHGLPGLWCPGCGPSAITPAHGQGTRKTQTIETSSTTLLTQIQNLSIEDTEIAYTASIAITLCIAAKLLQLSISVAYQFSFPDIFNLSGHFRRYGVARSWRRLRAAMAEPRYRDRRTAEPIRLVVHRVRQYACYGRHYGR